MCFAPRRQEFLGFVPCFGSCSTMYQLIVNRLDQQRCHLTCTPCDLIMRRVLMTERITTSDVIKTRSTDRSMVRDFIAPCGVVSCVDLRRWSSTNCWLVTSFLIIRYNYLHVCDSFIHHLAPRCLSCFIGSNRA